MAEQRKTVGKVYEILIKRIINLEYSPGHVLNESDIVKEFDLNKKQVRGIIQQLKDKKFLDVIPRYGAQVNMIDFRYMKSVFELVRVLEGYATRLAVEKISDNKIMELECIVHRIKGYDIETEFKTIISEDERFHRIIIESSQNMWLRDVLVDLKVHTEQVWFYFQQDLNDITLFYQTLSNIVEALKSKDIEKAEISAREHIDDFVGLIKRKLLYEL